MKCEICETELKKIDKLCDSCWYGMRILPEEWKAELKAKGIEIEKDIDCNIIPKIGFICGNPYKKKST